MTLDILPGGIRTNAVEKVLEPLVYQISALIGRSDSRERAKGLSRSKANVLEILKTALDSFIKQGEDISQEYPEVKENFEIALADIRETGSCLYKFTTTFLDNPTDADAQAELSNIARTLLSAVTRILILADLSDVRQLYKHLDNIKDDVENISHSSDKSELDRLSNQLEKHLANLEALLNTRRKDLLDLMQQEDLDSAHHILNLGCKMIISTTKSSCMFPQLATIRANRDFARRLTIDAIDRLGWACSATYVPENLPPLQGQAIAKLIDKILKSAQAGVETTQSWNASTLKVAFKELATDVSALMESAGLADNCQTLINQNLHDLSAATRQFIEATNLEDPMGLLKYFKLIEVVCARLSSSISKAAHMLGLASFMTNDVALNQMAEASKNVHEEKLVNAVTDIQNQTADLIDAALCVCGISRNEHEVRTVRQTTRILEQLTPQLINSAKALALRNHSPLTTENFHLFHDAYKSLVQNLHIYVDHMTEAMDFLDIYESLIHEDMRACLAEAEVGETSKIMNLSRLILARCSRIKKFFGLKLETTDETAGNADQIGGILENLHKNLGRKFIQAAREVSQSLRSLPRGHPNLGAIHRASEDICAALRDLRSLLQEIQPPQDIGRFDQLEDIPPASILPPPHSSNHDSDSSTYSVGHSNPLSQRSASPRGRRRQQQQQQQQWQREQQSPRDRVGGLEAEIAKFETQHEGLICRIDTANKKACGGVISLARGLANQLDGIVNCVTSIRNGDTIADSQILMAVHYFSDEVAQFKDVCQEFSDGNLEIGVKSNLLASLKDINFFSHQLAIRSKVMAEIDKTNEELIFNSAVTIIQIARDLISAMTSVIEHCQHTPAPQRVPSRESKINPVEGMTGARSHAYTGPSKFTVRVERSVEFSY